MLLKPFVKGRRVLLPLPLSCCLRWRLLLRRNYTLRLFLLFRVMNWKSPALMSLSTIPRVIIRIR